MALFKTFRGKRADLGAQELRDGFAYFCTDDGTFHIDFLDTDGKVKRKQINAKDAETLLGHSIEEFLLASENGSFAHGNGATATGDNSYAGGQDTVASGMYSHAGGSESEAGGENAFAHGEKVYAYGKNQTVFGQYNKEDNDALFIVGGGDSEENRKNLFVVKKDGSIVGLNTSNALTKTVSGEAIRIDDASPIEHEMDVKVSGVSDLGAVKVKKYGKNILDVSTAKLIATRLPNHFTKERTQDGIKTTVVGDRTFTETAYAGYRIGSFEELKGKTLTVSFGGVASDASLAKRINAIIYDDSHSNYENDGYVGNSSYYRIITYANNTNILTFTVPTEADARYNNVGITLAVYPGGVALQDGNVTEYTGIQVEIGDSATGFESSKGATEYEVSADGTVEGISPYSDTTTLMTDTAGAVIDCTYNRDINRVLDDTGFMYDNNPVGTGSFSMNRKVGSEVGDYSFTEGYSATAAGRYSHAGGEASQAKGVGSFAHGQRVTADADYQATFGTHNEVNNTAAFVVGNGNETTKSNAFEVQKDGNAFVKGNLYIGGTGSSAVSAKEVATAEAVSLIDRRITKVEDILASSSGEFIEDSEVAYAKVVPNNVAQYASLNKVGGLGIRQSNFVNLFPATYNIAKGSTSGDYTFTYDDNGVITITDATPLEEWEYEPYFSADFSSLCDVELSAGTYTLTFEAEGAPFALRTGINGESVQIGGYWDGEGLSSPYTFTLTEDSILSFDLGFACDGSYYCPPGEPTDFTYRIMLNKGSNALPWKAPSALGNDAPYIEPPKVTSIDVIGKNVFDYGAPRALGEEVSENYPGYWYQANVTEEGSFILETLVIEGEIGPGTDVGETFALEVAGINTTRVYPAGVYSVSSSVMCGSSNQDEIYLSLSIKLLSSNAVRTNLTGSNITIEDPFTITCADIVYKPATATSYVGGVSIPLTLAYGTTSLDEFVPFNCKTLQIPETIVSRDDYGLGISNTRTLFNNYIDFEEKQFIKKCLSMELTSGETEFYTHLTAIDIEMIDSAMRCSDPSLVYEFSRYGPEWGCFRVYFEYPGDADDYVADLYASGTPIQMFFGTTIGEKIDISAELAGIDNFLAVETGGLIIFNNDQQAAVPSTIEYQSTLTQGEIEEL